MGQLRVQIDDDFYEWPLASTELVGRHWRSSLRIRSAAVPQFWLELRWRGPSWSWRTLAATETTRGTGAVDAAGWRHWDRAGGVVRLDHAGALIELRLLDAGPPEPLLAELATHRRLPLARAHNLIERWPDGRIWPLGVDVDSVPALEPGDVFVHDERVYQLLETGPLISTDRVGPSIAEPELGLGFDLERMEARIEGRGWDASVRGECVRVVAAYARARLSDGDGGGGGWLPTEAAFDEWVALGGRPESPQARLGWERGKFRSQLAQQGVSALERLFETRRHGGLAEVRLALTADQISLVGED
jgi:hypothetical protein